MRLSKIIAAVICFLLTLFSLQGVLAENNIQSYPASQKGLEIIGTIIHSAPHQNQNVTLIKIQSSKGTFAKTINSILILGNESYVIKTITENYIELESEAPGKKMRLYKFGFVPPLTIEKMTPVPVKPKSLSGKFSEPGFNREEGNITITEEFRKKILEKDLPTILMQAAAEPQMDAQGRITGFGLYDIEKDSIYAKLGLNNGDIIKSINGEELNSPQGAIKLLNSLRNASSVNMIIERGGQNLPMNLDVK